MIGDLRALLGHARWMPAEERAALADGWLAGQLPGTLLVATCHRAELYGSAEAVAEAASAAAPGVRRLAGADVARHLIRLAVGRDSAVVGEDQILHQLRVSANHARAVGPLGRDLDRLLDLALHAGRHARSWLPASRPTLVDVALDSAIAGRDLGAAGVHVVGSGEMGRHALVSLIREGARPSVSSRTRETARALAERWGASDTDFDPGPERLAEVRGVFVALAGRWPISAASRQALVNSDAWVVDLSSPPAIDSGLSAELGERLVTIDELAQKPGAQPSGRLLARLDGLIEQTVAAFEQWATEEARREAAHALASRARSLQNAELDRLWRRVPSLDEGQRAEVERALEHLTDRLLRDPLEQLTRDSDGTQARAARDLFRL